MKSKQAENVIRAFGGAHELAAAIGLTASTVYRWTYPRERGGTNGLVPTRQLELILERARELGVTITSEDLYPPKDELETLLA